MDNIKNVFNIIGFQAGWWACVLGVKNGYPYFGPAIIFIFLLNHFLLFKSGKNEFLFIIIVGIVGTVMDTILLRTALIKYHCLYTNNLAPLWITAMWVGFAATVNNSMAWLNRKWFLSFALGAIFGPLSYLTGIKFDALEFDISLLTLSILAIMWGIAIPLLYFFNEKIVREK
tara:strand:+ start:812 stop:1330 length:519 start_codon:yes stop_codon:yes gene_type:complete